MGTREDGERRDYAADHGAQPTYHTQTQIKMERSAEDTRPDIVHKVPRSGNGIWAVSKACGYIQRENFCRSRQTETRQMVQ